MTFNQYAGIRVTPPTKQNVRSKPSEATLDMSATDDVPLAGCPSWRSRERRQPRIGRFTTYLLTLAFGAVGAVWIPVASAGGVNIEFGNLAELVLVATIPVRMLVYRQPVVFPGVLRAVGFALVAVILGLALRDVPWIGLLLAPGLSLGAAIAVANLPNLDTERIARATRYGFALLTALFTYSAFVAGQQPVAAVTSYLRTGDRSTFVFGFIRGTLNAHAGSVDVTNQASMINLIASSYALMFTISACFAVAGNRVMRWIAALSGAIVLLSFSSAAVVSCAIVVVILATVWARNAQRWSYLLPLRLFGPLVVAIFAWRPLVDYLGSNLASDAVNRQSRLRQYSGALESIDQNPILGVGLVGVDGSSIHNFLLFAWATTGLVGLLAAGMTALVGLNLASRGLTFAHRSSGNVGSSELATSLLIATLPVLFVVRLMVGGNGGMPAGSSLIGLGLAVGLMFQRVGRP